MTWSNLSAFSLASFEMDAQMGGSHRYADAVTGVEDQISLSPQAMGMLGNSVATHREQQSPTMGEGEGLSSPKVNLSEAFGGDADEI